MPLAMRSARQTMSPTDLLLLAAEGGDAGHHAGDALDAVEYFGQRAAGLLRPRDARLHVVAAFVHADHGVAYLCLDAADELADFLGGRAGLLGQLADLVGDHRKAAPLFAGPRRFDGGIERQQVGLLGDAANHRDDGADAVGTLAQRMHVLGRVRNGPLDRGHAGDRLGDDSGAAARDIERLVRGLCDLARRVGHFAAFPAHERHRGRRSAVFPPAAARQNGRGCR